MANVYKLKGHEKFVLREGWLSKGLFGVQGEARVFTISDCTERLAVGSNMVKSIRYWMQAFGLIEESPQNGAHLTELGNLIVEHDPYIEDDFTLWVLHSKIAQNEMRSTVWYLFFNKCTVSEFSKEDIFHLLRKELVAFAETDKFPDGSLKDDIDVLVNMYSRNIDDNDPEDKNRCPFATLGLLRKDENVYVKQQPNLNRLSDYVLLYELISMLQEEKTISIDAISERAFNIYNLSRVSVNSILDKLDNAEFIRVNRTAGLDVIYLLTDMQPMDVIQEYYNNR